MKTKQGNQHWQIAIITLTGVGLLLPIIAGTMYLSDEDTPLVIDGSPIIAEGKRGSDVVLEAFILNRGKRIVRVLGASMVQSCMASGCAQEVPDLPMEIKGHESSKMRVVYRIGRLDEPPYILTLYTDCVTQPNLYLTIRNRAME